MPRISDIEILCRIEQPAIVVRAGTNVENLPALIAGSYGKMAAYLKEIGEYLAYVPYVAYHNMDMRNLDVEMGYPVAKPLPGKGDILPGAIPGGKVVFCMYRGAYSELGPIYGEMAKWIEDNGFAPAGTAYEHYYNGHGFPESEMLTMVAMPIA